MTAADSPPGWYQDPTGQGDGRYWNGTSWTESVDRGGATVNVPIDPSQAQIPPVPGTQVSKPIPYATGQTVNVSNSKSSPWAVIIGVGVVVLAVIAIFVAVSGDSSDDTPTPGTEAPAAPATEAPAAPVSDGG
jgi:hypothetical protein